MIEVLETLSSEKYSTCHQNSESHACLPENCCKKKNDPATLANCAEQPQSTLAKEMPPLKKARLVSCAQEKNNINTDLLEALDSHSQDLTGDTNKIKEVSRLCCESTNAVPHLETTSLVDTNNYQVDGKIIKSFKTFRISIKCSGKVKRWLDIKVIINSGKIEVFKCLSIFILFVSLENCFKMLNSYSCLVRLLDRIVQWKKLNGNQCFRDFLRI